ncbi:MAG: glycosyl transferase family 1, partial [Micrococcales bacterium]
MDEVKVSQAEINEFATTIGAERLAQVQEAARGMKTYLDGNSVWHVNATETGGGVAEMLVALIPLWRDLNVDARWLVLHGEPDFFAITKRIHNMIHGSAGDGAGLTDADREVYDRVTASNVADLRNRVRPGDVVVLHDPQTAGMIPAMKAHGAHVVWRSHIGKDEPNEYTEQVWAFLAPYLADADRVIVTRPSYTPPSVPADKVTIITPCIDPFTAKNTGISDDEAVEVLTHVGLIEGEHTSDIRFPRPDGTQGTLRRHPGVVVAGTPLPADARFVVQVSRWDRLKDMAGVMRGFIDHVEDPHAHLVLCGPAVEGVSDDPEGAEVLAECKEIYESLDPDLQSRVHLVCVPMDDTAENAFIVNALQRHAQIVVQKSLFEGFGLTVTEAMWKARPVIASAIGGIQDQIEDGVQGILLADPHDLKAMGEAINRVLADDTLAQQLGKAAKERVRERFLGDVNLIA